MKFIAGDARIFVSSISLQNRRGEFPDFTEGIIVKRRCTVEEICRHIHRSLVDEFDVRGPHGASVEVQCSDAIANMSFRYYSMLLYTAQVPNTHHSVLVYLMCWKTRMLYRS